MNQQLDINDVVNGLLDQISTQAKEIAMLRVQVAILTKPAEPAGGEEKNGNE